MGSVAVSSRRSAAVDGRNVRSADVASSVARERPPVGVTFEFGVREVTRAAHGSRASAASASDASTTVGIITKNRFPAMHMKKKNRALMGTREVHA